MRIAYVALVFLAPAMVFLDERLATVYFIANAMAAVDWLSPSRRVADRLAGLALVAAGAVYVLDAPLLVRVAVQWSVSAAALWFLLREEPAGSTRPG